MEQPKKDLLKKLLSADYSKPSKASEGVKDITGLTFSTGSSASIPSRYEKIAQKMNWNPNGMDGNDMEKQAYLNQSGGEVFSNMLVGFGKQALAGVIDSVAAYDMGGMYDMASGNAEQEYGNWLNEIGKDIRESSEENNPIFQDGDSMWNTAYWAKQGQSLGYTGGIIAETIAEQVALSYLTGGSGNLAGLASKTGLLKQGVFGMAKGIQEGYMNALETQSNVYQKYQELGYDEETSRRKANEAATLGYRAEVGPLAALNALQFMATFGVARTAFGPRPGANLGFSGGVETLVDKALPELTNKWGKLAVGMGVNAVSESIEEGIQTGVGKYAQHETLKSTGDESGDLNLWDSEMRDSMIGGALGGVLFAGAGKLLAPYTQGTAAKQYNRAHDNFINEATTRTAAAMDVQQQTVQTYRDAVTEYNKNKSKANLNKVKEAEIKAREASYNSQLANTVNALQLDYITGKDTAYESHIEQMQTLLDAVKNQDLDTLKKFNILDDQNKEKYPGALKEIRDNFEQNIKDSETIKNKLDNNLLNVTSDFQSAYDITKKEYINEKNLDQVSKYEGALNTLYSNDKQFSQLSTEGQRRFKLEAELESFKQLSKLSEVSQERQTEIQEALKEMSDYNANDKLIVDSIPVGPYISGNTSIVSTRQAIEDVNKDLAKLRDPKRIERRVRERTARNVAEATSQEEVDEIVEEAQAQGAITPEIEAIAEKTKSEIAAKEEVSQITPEFIPAPSDIVEGSEPELNTGQELNDILDTLYGNQQFSPREVQPEFSPEQIERAKTATNNLADSLERELGMPPTFDHLIADRIKRTSFDKAEEKFLAYKKAWELSGRDVSGADRVYAKYFDASGQFEEVTEGFLGNDRIVALGDQAAYDAIVETSKPVGFDKDNQPVVMDGEFSQGYRTATPKSKAAFVGVQYEDVEGADGTIIRRPALNRLNTDGPFGNMSVFNPDIIKVDTILDVVVPENVNSIPVADWTFTDGVWTREQISFGNWLAKYNVEVGSNRYNNKIPMVAMIGDQVGFPLHDTDWYNSTNIAPVENQQEIERQGKLQNQELRRNILAGNNKIRVEERKFGSIFKLNTLATNNDPISLTQATGETRLAIALERDVLGDSTLRNRDTGYVSDQMKLVNTQKFEKGMIYEIREVNTREYLASPVLTNDPHKNEPINDIAYNTVKYGLMSSILLNGSTNEALVAALETQYGLTISKAQAIQAEIRANSGYDIKYEIGKFMDMFVNVTNTNEMIRKLESSEVNDAGKDKYPAGTNYISVDGKAIKITYKENSQPVARDARGYDTLPGINLGAINDRSVPFILQILETNFGGTDGRFRNTNFDVSKEQLGRNMKFTNISATGDVIPFQNIRGEQTYEGYIKDSVKTNIQSFGQVQPDGTTKWITDVQPMVYFGLVSNQEIQPEVTLQERVQQAAQETRETLQTPQVASIEEALQQVPDELKAETLRILQGIDMNDINMDFNFARHEFTQEQIDTLNSIQGNEISSLDPLQQSILVNSLFNLILADSYKAGNYINLGEIARKIDSSLETYLQPEIDKVKATRDNLVALNNPAMGAILNKFNDKIAQLETVIAEKDKLIHKGVSTTDTSIPMGSLYKKFERFFEEDLTALEDVMVNDDGELEYSFDMSALEKDVKLSFSTNLKVFFAGINKQKARTREDIKNFAYLNDYVDVDEVIGSLTEVMVGLPSSIEDLISILETKKEIPVYNQILNKIKSVTPEVQNEILYKMIQSKLDMQMVLYSFDSQTNTYTLSIINPNSTASDIKTKQQWVTNFRNSDLFRTVGEERVYNKEVVNNMTAKIDELAKDKNLDTTTIRDTLSQLGLELPQNTVDRLITRDGDRIYSTTSGILGVFNKNLKEILAKNENEERVTLDDPTNSPFKNASGVINDLIDIDVELNGTRVSKSFRVGGKSIQGAIQKMMVYDIKEDLKNPDSELVQNLSVIPYSKNNYVLNLLKNNPKFREYFDISFASPEAIKQNKQKVFDDRKINKLSATDNMLTQYALFQNTLRELGQVIPGSNLRFRMGHMFNPSLSDKEQMILYSTALVDLDYKDFNLENDTVEVSNEVMSFLTEQIYGAEFDRIVNTYKNPTNIKNYDAAGKRFLTIPELNNMSGMSGANIHDAIKEAVKGQNADFEALKNAYFLQARDIVKSTIKANVDSKVNVELMKGDWFFNGFLENNNDEVVIKYFDSKYLNNKKGQSDILGAKLAQIAAYDFVINQYLNQNNTYQLVAGDQALYAPSIKKYTNKQTEVIDNVAFSKGVGESITKRMAMLIAPGNKLANSKGDKYLQIFLNDPVKVTSTAREFIKQYYGRVSSENAEHLDTLDSIENRIQALYEGRRTNELFDNQLEELQTLRDTEVNWLKKNNPDIGGYFEIEGTDAQEYTTWKEHLNSIFRQGRLSEEDTAKVQAAYNKLEQGQDLDPGELAVVMNPFKPVYSGAVPFYDASGKASVNRIVYIKSSSFPLLPQLTRDFKLDKIRQQMERLEATRNKSVRLSYQTANKVGAINTKLTTDELYNIPFDELYADGQGKLMDSVLELDRDNFKIQQDTPYKTAKFLKKNSDDMTTMGSQMWKLILGNGVNKIDDKIFPNHVSQDLLNTINTKLETPIVPVNGMVSGRDLDAIKFHSERMYFDIQKELLYDELGIDRETRQPVDTNETIKLLHKLLEREVTTRQYPDGIMDNLDLVYTEDELEFVLPIWLSNGSNKFESLLQSIITNRLIQISLPGNQHISASSEGFNRVTSIDQIDSKAKSQVVWVNPNHTGELKATYIDGQLHESEVLLQSKFRKTVTDENGNKKTKLIDLTQAPYSTRNSEGMLVLNKEMIDDELLSSFSFRIPTSSHQSGAILKVVGFLPEASGDTLVVPKEHTQQLGEDFDIDKRTLYKSNYTVGESGQIRKLNYAPQTRGNKFQAMRTQTKMLENAMIDVYKSVYQSSSPEIQKRINKILSFDNATQTANLINDRLNSSIDDKYFSTYSDNYQRDQMKLGADGKTGIGGHSNAVTFQAQMERLQQPLQLRNEVKDEAGDVIGYTAKTIRLGQYESDGTLGSISTLDGERNIGDVHTENQNSSTDNIKAQIMGKRNENPYTMGVLTQLTYRGFDMGEFTRTGLEKVQVPSLFISQPILRRMVELREQNKSITSAFDPNADETIFNTLLQEFNPNGDVRIKQSGGTVIKTDFLYTDVYNTASARMTGDVLYDNLINQEDKKTWSSDIQLAVLQKFFILEDEAKALGKYQSLINLSTSGLGISYFNVLDRIKTLNDLGYEEKIRNAKDLVGEFIHRDDFQENIPANADEFTLIGDFFIRPTTTEGTVLVQSVSSGEDIMDISFPYKEGFITSYIDTIIEQKGKDLGKKAKMDLQYKVVNSIKDYIYSANNTGLFNGDVNNERSRLFFDTEENESLASYLKKLKDSRNYPLMYSNELLKSFIFDGIMLDGSPSIIKHQSDLNTNFDKTDKYNSFLELVQDNITDLGTFNGEQMTPRKLAQDLATYAYLANNENGAIGFKDYVNVKYLNIAGVSQSVRDINKSRNGWDVTSLMSNFSTQFYQHNPEEARIISPNNTNIESFSMLDEASNNMRNRIRNASEAEKKELFGVFLKNLKEFTLRDMTDAPDYISIRNTDIKLSDNQYNLYKWDGTKYNRIPVLGTFGFNEYNPSAMNQRSLIYPEIGNDYMEQMDSQPVLLTANPEMEHTESDVSKVLREIKNPQYVGFAQELLPYVDPETKVIVRPTILPSGKTLNAGMYNNVENTIYINPGYAELARKAGKSEAQVAKEIEEIQLEEIIHSITVNEMKRFGELQGDGVFRLNDGAPIFMQKLVGLYDIAKKKLPYNTTDNYYSKDIFEFVAGAFVDAEYQNKLDSIDQNGKSLLDHFKDAIASMIRYVTGASFSQETRNTVFELLRAKDLQPVTPTPLNVMEQMKQEDIVIDQVINPVERVEIGNNLTTAPEYNKETSDVLIEKFKQGDELKITPTQSRSLNEKKYMQDIISFVEQDNGLPKGSPNVLNYVNILPISETQQLLSYKKVSSMNNFSAQEIFRLPEIKKC